MEELKPRKWSPIEPLQHDWKETLEDPGIAALVRVWQEQEEELRHKSIYNTFVDRLRREWAIETGVLERLYDINDSATRVLIEQGLDAAFLSTSDVDKPIDEVIALMRDQETAIESMYSFIAHGRTLSTGYIKELHAVITAHQPTSESVDADGSLVAIPLRRGEWRTMEAQVTDSHGQTWLYCEPSLLEAQMLNLVEEYARQESAAVPVDIRAAWLHHRFSIIHPFQDGNGRVARCLATLVLLKERWFPLVVTRRDGPRYIAALRAADTGDLTPLVTHFNELQKRTIRRALSMSESVIDATQSITDALEEASRRLQTRMEQLVESERRVRTVAEVLRNKATERLQEVALETDKMVKRFAATFGVHQDEEGFGEPRDYYYRHQIVESAKQHDYYANLLKYRAWSLVAFTTDQRAEIIFSFHGIGRDSRGVLCCTAIYCTKESDDIQEVLPLTSDPFEFTHRDDPVEVAERFTTWMNSAITSGIQRWAAHL